MPNPPLPVHARLPWIVTHVVTACSVLGFAGLLLTILLGFEEPNRLLLWISCGLAVAAPIAVLIHLTCTPALTAERKRVWWKAFASGDVFSALSEYLSSPDLGGSADRRAIVSQRRSRLTKT